MNGQPSRKIIIDTDAGLDDAQAILMALASDDVEVVAITTVMGNAGSPQVAKNVLRILKLADRVDVRVYIYDIFQYYTLRFIFPICLC